MKTRTSLQDKAELAIKKAVRGVVEHHKKTGRPLAISVKGKTLYVSPFKVKNKS